MLVKRQQELFCTGKSGNDFVCRTIELPMEIKGKVIGGHRDEDLLNNFLK